MEIGRHTVVMFPVWPERQHKPYYVKVFVFPDRMAMMLFWREQVRIEGLRGKMASEDFAAITRTWTGLTISVTKKRWIQNNCIGHMLLYRQRLGAGIIGHEMSHLALRWAEVYAKIPPAHLYHGKAGGGRDNRVSTANEERYCHIVGSLVAQFWRNFYARAPISWHAPKRSISSNKRSR